VALHKTRGQVFLCPCHLSIYDVTGKVLDGPAPRALDLLPIKVSATGEIEVIDIEYKAGTRQQDRIT
jgi:Rieske Fe-S protein